MNWLRKAPARAMSVRGRTVSGRGRKASGMALLLGRRSDTKKPWSAGGQGSHEPPTF